MGSDYDDAWSEPEAREWVTDVLTNMVPKMVDSAVVMSLLPRNGLPDVKFCVELGYALMLEKPLILIGRPDVPIPARLLAVADEVIIAEDITDPSVSRKLSEAVKRVIPD